MNNSQKRAFTLVELLVVITIIGLVSSAALVMLKDTAEVKALAYTKKVMSAYKSALAQKEEDEYFTGFVNDFGTMAPDSCFLNNSCDTEKYRFVKDYDDNSLPAPKNHRFTKMNEQDSSYFSAPFMNSGTSPNFKDDLSGSSDNINQVLYVGYQGDYIGGDGDVLDGWNTSIHQVVEHNISVDNGDGKEFLTLTSAGSDRHFDDETTEALVREEFDLSKDLQSVEALYANDNNLTHDKREFILKSLRIKVCTDKAYTSASDINISLLIYSPMLYYVEDSTGETCTELNTTHAECDDGGGSEAKKYIAYYTHDKDFVYTDTKASGLKWHIGLMKMQLFFNPDNNESRLFINKGGILDTTNDDLAYDFNSSNTNLTNSAFFDDFTLIDANNTDLDFTFESEPKDDNNPFYIYGGTKVVSLWENNSSGWSKTDTKLVDFKPGRQQLLEMGCE